MSGKTPRQPRPTAAPIQPPHIEALQMPASIKGRRVTDDAARNIAEAITAEFNWLANGDHPEPIRKAAGGHTLVAASRALAAVYSQITGTGPTTPPDALRQLATALDNAMAAYAQEQRRPRH